VCSESHLGCALRHRAWRLLGGSMSADRSVATWQAGGLDIWGRVMRNRRVRRRRWQETVIAKANLLEHEGELLYQQAQLRASDSSQEAAIRDAVRAAVQKHLQYARMAAGDEGEDGKAGEASKTSEARKGQQSPRPRSHHLLPAGARCEGAFANLHAAQVTLVNLYTDEKIKATIPAVLERLQKCLPETDQRLLKAKAALDPEGNGTGDSLAGRPRSNGRNNVRRLIPVARNHRADHDCSADALAQRRAALRDAMQVGYEAQDELYAQVRNFRNILFTGTVLLTLLVTAVCIVGALRPGAVPLCFQPSNTAGTSPPPTTGGESFVCPSTTGYAARPTGGDVSIVALMGLLGGALSATFTVQKLRGTSTPYGVPVALAILKLPAGALTAITGLVLLYGKFVPGLSELDSQGQILAYAIVLGIAQHLVTRFVDQKAEDVLGSVPSKERSSTSAQPAAEATQPSSPTTTTSATTRNAADRVSVSQ
jgi:hypothetical protein